ncbi:MAG: DUF4440 domain-containing protein [Bacteroidetes bacterium]|nr:DUF4440 domain-containing protein [Bacteroidota bacterium]
MTKSSLNLFALFLLIYMSSCNTIDMEIEIKSLMEVDAEFSDYSVEHGRNDAFLKYLDKEGVLITANAMPFEGYDQFKKLYEGDDQSYQLSWKPTKAFVSQSGDLGYTYGIYDLLINETDTHSYGSYVSIWKKNNQGDWKLVMDLGNEGLGIKEN